MGVKISFHVLSSCRSFPSRCRNDNDFSYFSPTPNPRKRLPKITVRKWNRQKVLLLGENYVYAFMYTGRIFYLWRVRMEIFLPFFFFFFLRLTIFFLRRQFTPHSIHSRIPFLQRWHIKEGKFLRAGMCGWRKPGGLSSAQIFLRFLRSGLHRRDFYVSDSKAGRRMYEMYIHLCVKTKIC